VAERKNWVANRKRYQPLWGARPSDFLLSLVRKGDVLLIPDFLAKNGSISGESRSHAVISYRIVSIAYLEHRSKEDAIAITNFTTSRLGISLVFLRIFFQTK